MKRVRAFLTGIGALSAAFIGTATVAEAQLAAYTGRFAGGADADGIVLELYEVEGGALAGQLDAGEDGRFLVTGHPSNAGIQGIISGDADHAFFHIERANGGLRFVFVPSSEDGRPSYDTARILTLTRTAPGLAFSTPAQTPAAVSQASVPLRAPEQDAFPPAPKASPAREASVPPPPQEELPDLASPPVDPADVAAETVPSPEVAATRLPSGRAIPLPRPRPGPEIALTHPPVSAPLAEEAEAVAPAAAPTPAVGGFDPVAMARELGVDAIGFGGVVAPSVEAVDPGADEDKAAQDLPLSRDPQLRRQAD